jgi:hypothetical protein
MCPRVSARAKNLGVQPNFGVPELGGITFGAVDQQPTITVSLRGGRDGDRLQQ